MNRTFKIIIVCLFTALTVQAQDEDIEVLWQEGFEDIQTATVGDTIFVSIEDRAHRGTFRGAAAAIKELSSHHPEVNNFEVVLTDYKMPQLIVHASKREGIWDVRVDREMKSALQLLKNVSPQARSTGRIDLTIYPMVSLVNNKLDHLFDYSVRIAPAIGVTLWKGGRLTLQPIFPILHKLDDTDSKRYIQVGNTNISQQFISTKRWQLSAALGFFHSERAGIQAQVDFHALRGLDISLEAGYTTQANYDATNGFGFSRTPRFNALLSADYYEPHSKLQIQVMSGRFLYGDYGVRGDISRHFGEYVIGIYGIHTGGENNAGFHFTIPFGGKRQKRHSAIRVRLPEYYSMEYSMLSYFRYWREKMGRTYVTQPDKNRSAHYWEPAYVQEYVSRMLNGDFK